MPILLLVLGVGVYLFLWHQWRTTTLTRDCRWRLDRRVAPDFWRCAVCGAEALGAEPRECLRARR
ncbi:hypothetical protein [Rhodobacter calidifons]|uniref:Uncharacterized protein n=1 Tax=Rhodobacter calidifons TaxID=2715277 RepID=A0ABX0G2W1_9RHOB|nr:hypothetical protein [Rhodobacter calidifons]NHB75426.1 hypothetical protein [Rhodobacter calidifons]